MHATNCARSLTADVPPPPCTHACKDYPAYPLLDNRLVPFAAGSATLAAGFGATASSIALSVKDTYLPGWPAASVLSDSSVLIAANMSEGLAVAYQLLPAAQLDLGSGGADPPSAAQVAQTGALLLAQAFVCMLPRAGVHACMCISISHCFSCSFPSPHAGVTLLPNATGGPAFYSGVASGLTPGTNYTLLAAVSFGGGAVVSSGLAALSGLLVPDTAPPSFTAAAVRGVAFGAAAGAANSSGSSSGGSSDRFTVTLEVGLDEPGSVAFALYGDPACITGERQRERQPGGSSVPARRQDRACGMRRGDMRAQAAQPRLFGRALPSPLLLLQLTRRPPSWPPAPTCATPASATAARRRARRCRTAGWSSAAPRPTRAVSQQQPASCR